MKSAIITATVLISVLLNRIPSSPLRKKGGKRKKREIKFPRELEEVTDKEGKRERERERGNDVVGLSNEARPSFASFAMPTH